MNKRQEIIKRDKSICQYCGILVKEKMDLHIDHIIPKVSGGNDERNNLIVSCDKCNLLKGCYSEEEFRDMLIHKINKNIKYVNHYLGMHIDYIDNFVFYIEKND